MTTPVVVVFDSGVGGLSVLAEIAGLIPGVGLVFAADNAFFPYGTKAVPDLIARVVRVAEAVVALTHPDIFVVACNTASTVCLPALRAHLSCPVVGVVPAIKPAAEQSASGTIGLLATPGTVRRPYTDDLIRRFAPGLTVVKVGSTELVELAERKLAGDPVTSEDLQPILAPFVAYRGLDSIVLACTHFPLLRDELRAAMPWPVRWIDSGRAIARRVRSLLPAASERGSVGFRALFSADNGALSRLAPALNARGCVGVEILPL
ncbi:MAG: glutamate racemase [Azospirillaceae bacterium]|nr:glutamate racemase [Azospirillaceae bacterium]